MEPYRNVSNSPRHCAICTLGRVEPVGDVDKLIAGLQRSRRFGHQCVRIGLIGLLAVLGRPALQAMSGRRVNCRDRYALTRWPWAAAQPQPAR